MGSLRNKMQGRPQIPGATGMAMSQLLGAGGAPPPQVMGGGGAGGGGPMMGPGPTMQMPPQPPQQMQPPPQPTMQAAVQPRYKMPMGDDMGVPTPQLAEGPVQAAPKGKLGRLAGAIRRLQQRGRNWMTDHGNTLEGME